MTMTFDALYDVVNEELLKVQVAYPRMTWMAEFERDWKDQPFTQYVVSIRLFVGKREWLFVVSDAVMSMTEQEVRAHIADLIGLHLTYLRMEEGGGRILDEGPVPVVLARRVAA